MIDTLLKWIGTFLAWLDNITGNYVIAIFIFAVVVEILMLPLSIKQQKNSIKQAKLRPKEMAIRKKYAGREDKVTQQKITAEIQELYQRENFNPAGGCLPLLIQFPIVLALYQIVIDPLKYVSQWSSETITAITNYLSPTIIVNGVETANAIGETAVSIVGYNVSAQSGTIKLIYAIQELVSKKGFSFFEGLDSAAYAELSESFASLPEFSLFGLNLGLTPSFTNFNWLLIIPVLTFVFYFASMKLTRKFTYQPTTASDQAMGCSNNVMDVTMPLMSVYFTFIVPAAVAVYWIFKSILGTIKQFILHKTMPMPRFTEEDYKAAEREMNGKAKQRPKTSVASGSGTKVRSLHHIDDDDEEYVTFTNKPENTNTETAKKAPSLIEKAPLKSDDDKNASVSEVETSDASEASENIESQEVEEAKETQEDK